jgi:hypothetical protein
MTAILTLKQALDDANPANLADALAKVKIGTLLTPVTATVTISPANASITLPAYLAIQSIQVTGVGTGALGARFLGGLTATPSATVVRIAPLTGIATFEGTVTDVEVTYLPAPDTALTAAFAE